MQAVISQHPVLAGNVYNIAGYAYRYQIKIAAHPFKGYIIFFGKRLYQLKAYPAARKLFIRIFAIRTFRVENGNGGGYFIAGGMVVANNKINSFFGSISHFINRFYAAIQRDN